MSNKSLTSVFVIFILQFGINEGQSRGNCNLDDIQKTPGICKPIKECRYAIAQLYAGPASVKRCPGTTNAVCCPTAPTLSQKKCSEWQEILKTPETFSQPAPEKPVCAYKGQQQFIVGGRNAHEFEFPHAVGLGYGNDPNKLDFNCGATLISDQYLLTAAHCLTNSNGKPTYAVIGDLTLKEQTSIYRKKLRIVKSFIHPNYTSPLIYNDIGILKLEQRLEINRYVLPACIGDPMITPKDGGEVKAIGWGLLGYSESRAENLQAVQLKIVGAKPCNAYFESEGDRSLRYPQGVLRSQVCALGEDNKDTCNGDSGGGIVVNPEVNCLYHVVGVTSVGSTFCGIGIPGFYTKVASYMDWIERIVWG